jgi:hypothetical protein
MNFYQDDNKPNNAEISNSAKMNQNREREGIIPVTANILKEAEVTKDEAVTYQGIPLNDINIVGYIIDYKELESKIKLKLCDFTGTIEIYFFVKMNERDTTWLSKFNYDGSKKPAQIFGTVKVYKNEKNIQGEKIMAVPCINVLAHRADVIHSWLYLTGKLNELKENQIQNSAIEAKNIAMGINNYGYGNNNTRNTPVKKYEDKDMREAIYLLDNYVKKHNNNEISHSNIKNLFKNFGKRLNEVVNMLINNNKLIDTDRGYEIMN